ncbi:NUDIX hydrolase [Ruegeria sp. ANG-R]|uniref:NUDIX hydrolase n=1 Tax=Ruegeria sp. ANG-R TaxID=1577903 RepID=UPI00057F7D4C|nr:NUDIX hydrolase [Ruegeria sp. ANG-R]KIC42150.1 NUDIX hydrolase [Ruegeria sp. ANG-R]
MSENETADQIAALPMRWDKSNKLRILMVTSRDRGRWVIPKGWLMDGKKPWHAAEIEALEEAGAVGFISKKSIGRFHYDKRYEGKSSVHCRVTLYPLIVEKLKRRWKERDQRKRHWFSPAKAARLVEEEELSRLLRGLSDNQETLAVIEKLRKAA